MTWMMRIELWCGSSEVEGSLEDAEERYIKADRIVEKFNIRTHFETHDEDDVTYMDGYIYPHSDNIIDVLDALEKDEIEFDNIDLPKQLDESELHKELLDRYPPGSGVSVNSNYVIEDELENEMNGNYRYGFCGFDSRGIGRGWHLDPYRHALAARGIPTAALRIARQYHISRPYRDRVADEARKEPLTNEIKLWSENINAYDIEGIDDPIPKGFRIKRTIIPSHGYISERYVVDIIDEKTGDVAGYISAVNDERTLHASLLFIQNEYQKRGLSRYLMREMCNIADEMGKNMVLQISSLGDIPNDALLRYYRSFGFEPHPTDGHSYVRRPRG